MVEMRNEKRVVNEKTGKASIVTDVVEVLNIPEKYSEKFLMFDNKTKTLVIRKTANKTVEEKAETQAKNLIAMKEKYSKQVKINAKVVEDKKIVKDKMDAKIKSIKDKIKVNKAEILTAVKERKSVDHLYDKEADMNKEIVDLRIERDDALIALQKQKKQINKKFL